MKPIEMHQTPDSSSIASWGYDEASKTLAIVFTSGRRFEYPGVAPNVALGLADADSAGRYYNENIRGKYDGEMVDDFLP